MDLPTYTNIWRIEKRLYKLYDFRLPAPLPITWIAVFTGITVPYILFLVVIGLPFNHNLVWLYILPPGVLTWLTTRPVIESKRLPELVGSQLRYLAEPRTWCRMAPFAEKDDIVLFVRVWHWSPPGERTKTTREAAAPARQGQRARQAAVAAASVSVSRTAAPSVASWQASSRRPAAAAPPAQQRATAPARVNQPRAVQQRSAPPASGARPPAAAAGQPQPGVIQRPARAVAPPDRRQESRALEVSHDPEPGSRDLWEPRPAGAESGTGPVLELEPLPVPDPAAEVLPAPAAHDALAVKRVFWRKAPGRAPLPPPPAPAPPTPRRPPRVPAAPRRSIAARVAAMFIEFDEGRPVPSVERALSGPGSQDDASWQRRVKVVTTGHGPGQRGQQALDRDRARRPLAGSRRIAVLGCIGGAGQSVTALMVGHVLADVREVPVAALDLNTGDASLAAHIAPATSVRALLATQGPGAWPREDADPGPGRREDAEPGPGRRGSRPWLGRGDSRPRLDVIAVGPHGGTGAPNLGADDYQRLADLLAARYPLTMIDPAPSGLNRVLSMADQLVLVVPASAEAATSLANTQQWLTAHGYGELAARAVTVINGVSRPACEDVLLAESAARGRCRAIVRVPWDDLLSAWPDTPAALQPRTRHAYTALAGVLVAGLDPATAVPRTRVRRRSAGEHPD